MVERLPLPRHGWKRQTLGPPVSGQAADAAMVSLCWTFLTFLHFLPLRGLKFWHKGN